MFEDGTVIPWWTDHDRTVKEWSRTSAADAATFDRVDRRLRQLASYLQPFFLEEPPNVNARGWERIRITPRGIVTSRGRCFKIGPDHRNQSVVLSYG